MVLTVAKSFSCLLPQLVINESACAEASYALARGAFVGISDYSFSFLPTSEKAEDIITA